MKRRSFLTLGLATAARPVWAETPEKQHRIAIVASEGRIESVAQSDSQFWIFFFEELSRRGYVKGKNLLVERHTGLGSEADGYAEFARAVVATKPDMIIPYGSRRILAQALKAATTTIPFIVSGADPVAVELVDNLARSGGNITGISGGGDPVAFWRKRLELLQLAAPRASRIAFLMPHTSWSNQQNAIREAAERVGVTLVPTLLELRADEADLPRAFAQMDQEHVEALFLYIVSFKHMRSIIAWANERHFPTMCPIGAHAKWMGGLMAYGEDRNERPFHLAETVDKILKGTKAMDIPIYRLSKFELALNLATAKAIGMDFPPQLLTMATEVIE